MKVPNWLLSAGLFLLILYAIPKSLRRTEARAKANQELYKRIQSEGGLSSPTLHQFLLSLAVLAGLLYFLGILR